MDVSLEPVLPNLVGSLVSGAAVIAAALVPRHLDARRERAEVVREILDGRYAQPAWLLTLQALLLALTSELLATGVISYTANATLSSATVTGRYAMLAEEGEPLIFEQWSAYQDFLTRETYVFEGALAIGDFLLLPIAYLAIGVFVAHRSGSRGWLWLLLAVLAMKSIAMAANQSDPDFDYSIEPLAAVVALVAAGVGYLWGRRGRREHLLRQAFRRLPDEDQAAILDLARSVSQR